MSVGRLQLMMKVVLNSGEWLGIPWVFVRMFAQNALLMARLGFVETYKTIHVRGFNASLLSLAMEVRLPVLWDL